MKKTIISLIAAVLYCGGFFLNAQDDILAKLDKQGYCPITPGLTLKYANYDEDGEVSSYYILKVASVEGTMQEGTVVFHQYFLDEDGKAMFDGDNLPMTIIVNSEGTFSKMNDVGRVLKIQDLISNGDASSVRPPLAVGSRIPDGHISLSIGRISVSLNTIDRKVTDCRTVSTPAGTFKDSYLIKETQKTKQPFSTKTESLETWYALGLGCVKQKAYDDKGRLTQSQELIEITLD